MSLDFLDLFVIFQEPLFFRSLFEAVDRGESISEVVEQNPTLLQRYRDKGKKDLEDILDEFDIDPKDSEMDDDQYKEALKHLKERRKNLKNVSYNEKFQQSTSA